MGSMVRWRLGGAAYIRIYMASTPLSVHCPLSWLNMFSFRARIDAEHEHDPHVPSLVQALLLASSSVHYGNRKFKPAIRGAWEDVL